MVIQITSRIVLLFGKQNLKYLLCGLQRKCLLTPTLDSFVFFSKTAGFVSFSNSLLVKLKLLDLAFV